MGRTNASENLAVLSSTLCRRPRPRDAPRRSRCSSTPCGRRRPCGRAPRGRSAAWLWPPGRLVVPLVRFRRGFGRRFLRLRRLATLAAGGDRQRQTDHGNCGAAARRKPVGTNRMRTGSSDSLSRIKSHWITEGPHYSQTGLRRKARLLDHRPGRGIMTAAWKRRENRSVLAQSPHFHQCVQWPSCVTGTIRACGWNLPTALRWLELGVPRGEPLADLGAATLAALREPIDYPALHNARRPVIGWWWPSTVVCPRRPKSRPRSSMRWSTPASMPTESRCSRAKPASAGGGDPRRLLAGRLAAARVAGDP